MTGIATDTPTVLIIDDEMGILDTIRILLKSEGFIPYTALGGLLGFTALPGTFLLFLAAASVTYLLLVEVVKRRLMRRLLG